MNQARREQSAATTGRRTSKTWPGLALDLNEPCSTSARRPTDDWAPANDEMTLTARTARGFNSAWLRGKGAAGPKPDRSTDFASVAATITKTVQAF
jgi:hypothetical protein